MTKKVRSVLDAFGAMLTDRLLQMLLLGVIAAGFFFTIVLEADPAIVVGVLALGTVTAFLESAHHRRK